MNNNNSEYISFVFRWKAESVEGRYAVKDSYHEDRNNQKDSNYEVYSREWQQATLQHHVRD